MQVLFLPSETLPPDHKGPCIKLAGTLYCDYEVLKLAPGTIRKTLVRYKHQPKVEKVKVFRIQASLEVKTIFVVARQTLCPDHETIPGSPPPFYSDGKWWEVMIIHEREPGWPGLEEYTGSCPLENFLVSRETHYLSHPDAGSLLGPGDLFDGPPARVPFLEAHGYHFPTTAEHLLFTRLQQKIKTLKAVKRLRNQPDWQNTLNNAQVALDLAGMAPMIGNAADLINLCISLARGNYGEAAMNAVSLIPGSQLVTAGKLAIRSGRRFRKLGRMKVKNNKKSILNIETDRKLLKEDIPRYGKGNPPFDPKLESEYQTYLLRKKKEGKPPKSLTEWKEARDYWLNDSPMARGNDFNETAIIEGWYPFNEIHLANGKRLDSYTPTSKNRVGEIVSRKATNLEEIKMTTFEQYLKEFNIKYSSGTIIKSRKYPQIYNKQIEGELILEIPDTNKNINDIKKYVETAKKYNITLRFRPE